jgi:hypothetical protein
MRLLTRLTLVAATLTIAGGSAVGLTAAGTAAATTSSHSAPSHRDGDGLVLNAALAASAPTDPDIFGVKAGGVPWQIKPSRVRLMRNGLLVVNVNGLVVVGPGINPIPDLAATLYCNGSAVRTTAPVSFSTEGNARIRTMVSLPAFCPVPAVLLNPAKGELSSDILPVYIGFDGQGLSSRPR